MADVFKTIKVTQPSLGGPLNEALIGAVSVTGGAADAGKVVATDPVTGQVTATALAQIGQTPVTITNNPTTGQVLAATSPTAAQWTTAASTTVSVNGSPVSDPNFLDGDILWHVSGSDITATVQALATNTATPVTTNGNAPVHAGQLLISQPGNTAALWADPFVQGPWIDGTMVVTPGAMGDGTSNIQPVYVGGKSTDGKLYGLLTDSSKNLLVNVQNTPTVNIQASGTPLTVTGSSLNVNVTNSSGSTVTGGQTAETSAAWTSGTTVNTALALNVVGYGSVKITLAQGSTISGGVVSFEASDTTLGTNWYAINVSQDNAGPSISANSTYTLLASTLQSFTMSSAAWVQVRVRLSTTISGTATVNVGIAAMAFGGGSGGGGGSSGGGTQYSEGSTVPTATGTVALGKNASNVVLALKLDGSGNLDSNIQSANFAAVTGAALPPTTVWIAASDGTNLQGLLVESSTNKNLRVAIYSGASEATLTGASLNVNITNTNVSTQDAADVTAGTTSAPTKILIIGGKTADGTPAYDPLPLIAGGTAVSVSSVHDFTQGSTTSGQVGPLVQGAVSTSDPSYTTGQTDPLSLTLQGHLRTQDYAEANANGSTSVPNNAMFIGAKGADGFLHGLSSSTNDGKLDVNASFSGSVTTSFIADRIQSGTITSTQTVVVSTQGAASVVFNITGAWTGTIQFQAQLADNSWITATVYPVFSGGAGVTQTVSANGSWQLPCGGFQAFRVIGNTVATGTATANLEAGAGTFSSFVEQLTATNLNVTATQSGTWTVQQGNPPWSVFGTLSNNNAAPASTNQGVLPALVVSGAQSWTAGRMALLTVSTGGYLLTEDLSDGNANGSTAAPTTALLAGAKGADGFLHPLSTSTNNGFLDVNASISGSFTPALTQDNFTSPAGTITANGQSVTLTGNGTQGTGTSMFRISGTWNGTLSFQVSIDGSNFIAAKCLQRFPTGSLASSLVQNSGAVTYWSIATGGIRNIQVASTAWTSGTATIWIEAGAGAQDIQTLSIPFDPASGNFGVIKGSGATPLTTDNSLVVSLSPNSAITTTTVPTTGAEALVVALSPNSSQFATSTTANTLPGTNPQTIGVSSSAVVNTNAARKEVTIINTGTTIIYLGLGQTPTTTAYHIALVKCTAPNDGTGGTWTSDMWKGAVNAISSGAGGTVNLTELT